MSADELSQLEQSTVAGQYPKTFQPQLMAAYKWQAMPLTSRVGCREFTGQQFLLRNYTDLRWDKRVLIPDIHSIPRYTEFTIKVCSAGTGFLISLLIPTFASVHHIQGDPFYTYQCLITHNSRNDRTIWLKVCNFVVESSA